MTSFLADDDLSASTSLASFNSYMLCPSFLVPCDRIRCLPNSRVPLFLSPFHVRFRMTILSKGKRIIRGQRGLRNLNSLITRHTQGLNTLSCLLPFVLPPAFFALNSRSLNRIFFHPNILLPPLFSPFFLCDGRNNGDDDSRCERHCHLCAWWLWDKFLRKDVQFMCNFFPFYCRSIHRPFRSKFEGKEGIESGWEVCDRVRDDVMSHTACFCCCWMNCWTESNE